MKKNLLVLLSVLLICSLYFCTSEVEKSPSNPCNISAPDSLNYELVTPDSLILSWTEVTGATGGYQVILIDSVLTDTVLNTTVLNLSIGIGDLSLDHVHIAEVRPKCNADETSTNSIQRRIPPISNIIIGDIVVMNESGSSIDDCQCDMLSESSDVFNASSYHLLPSISPGERKVFKFIMTTSGLITESFSFNLAFDGNCREVKLLGGICFNDHSSDVNISLTEQASYPDGNNRVVMVVVSGTPVASISVLPIGAGLSTRRLGIAVNYTPLSIHLHECQSSDGESWEVDCS